MNVPQLLKKRADSVDDLKAKAEELSAALPDLRAAYEQAQAKRAELLLTGSDTAVLQAEGAATLARLAVDRAEAGIAEAHRQAEAKARNDAIAAIDAEIAAAEARADAASKRLAKEYPKIAGQLASLLQEVVEADRLVAAANAKRTGGIWQDFYDVLSLRAVRGVEERVCLPSVAGHWKPTAYVDLPPLGSFAGWGYRVIDDMQRLGAPSQA